jgi:hypothetical protein
MNWTFRWRDEEPVSLILLSIALLVIFLTPWESCDPLASLKTPRPAAAATP